MPRSAYDQLDETLARQALDKRRRGQTPTRREAEALRRVERAHEEAQRWAYYATIPQIHWRKMSGRQAKTLQEQAERYGIPFGEAVVDLPRVVKALHDFLAKKAHVLAAAETDDPLLVGGNSPALERYRDAKAKLANLELEAKRRELVPREQVHDALARVASILRAAGETIQRYSVEAHRVLDEALESAQREIDTLFPADDGDLLPRP